MLMIRHKAKRVERSVSDADYTFNKCLSAILRI